MFQRLGPAILTACCTTLVLLASCSKNESSSDKNPPNESVKPLTAETCVGQGKVLSTKGKECIEKQPIPGSNLLTAEQCIAEGKILSVDGKECIEKAVLTEQQKCLAASKYWVDNKCQNFLDATPVVVTDDAIVTQVNPKAFNAFSIWHDGQGSEILNYPEHYGAELPQPDEVFYILRSEYELNGRFLGTPTEGAKVENDLLEYPVRNGRQLKIKFTPISDRAMQHGQAMRYCSTQGRRLPTVRELFDFCAAGVIEPNYGPNFKIYKYPTNARCGGTSLFSASINPGAPFDDAWLFNNNVGGVSIGANYYDYGVRCVGEQ